MLTEAARMDAVVQDGEVGAREEQVLGGARVQGHGVHILKLGDDPLAARTRQHMHDLAAAHQRRLVIPLELHARERLSVCHWRGGAPLDDQRSSSVSGEERTLGTHVSELAVFCMRVRGT